MVFTTLEPITALDEWPPMSAHRIEDLDDVKAWIAGHDGRINAWWEAQHNLNAVEMASLKSLERRMSTLEKRVIWVTAFGAGVGAVIGTLLTAALKLL